MNTQVRYTLTAIWLHWLMAVLIFGLIQLGIYMSELPHSCGLRGAVHMIVD